LRRPDAKRAFAAAPLSGSTSVRADPRPQHAPIVFGFGRLGDLLAVRSEDASAAVAAALALVLAGTHFRILRTQRGNPWRELDRSDLSLAGGIDDAGVNRASREDDRRFGGRRGRGLGSRDRRDRCRRLGRGWCLDRPTDDRRGGRATLRENDGRLRRRRVAAAGEDQSQKESRWGSNHSDLHGGPLPTHTGGSRLQEESSCPRTGQGLFLLQVIPNFW